MTTHTRNSHETTIAANSNTRFTVIRATGHSALLAAALAAAMGCAPASGAGSSASSRSAAGGAPAAAAAGGGSGANVVFRDDFSVLGSNWTVRSGSVAQDASQGNPAPSLDMEAGSGSLTAEIVSTQSFDPSNGLTVSVDATWLDQNPPGTWSSLSGDISLIDATGAMLAKLDLAEDYVHWIDADARSQWSDTGAFPVQGAGYHTYTLQADAGGTIVRLSIDGAAQGAVAGPAMAGPVRLVVSTFGADAIDGFRFDNVTVTTP